MKKLCGSHSADSSSDRLSQREAASGVRGLFTPVRLLSISFFLLLLTFSPLSSEGTACKPLLRRTRILLSSDDVPENEPERGAPRAAGYARLTGLDSSRMELLAMPFYVLGEGLHRLGLRIALPGEYETPEEQTACTLILLMTYVCCALGVSRFFTLCKRFYDKQVSYVLTVALFASPFAVYAKTCLPSAVAAALAICAVDSVPSFSLNSTL